MNNTEPSTVSKLLKGKLTAVIVIFFVVTIAIFVLNTSVQARRLDEINKFRVAVQLESPVFSPQGEPFEITTNNCGSPVAATENWERSITFSVVLNWQISEELSQDIGAELGLEVTDVIKDKVQAKIINVLTQTLGQSNQITVGFEQSMVFSRQFITPPDSKAVYRLQWEVMQNLGSVALFDPEDNFIGNDFFYVIRDLRLTQIGVIIEPCNVTAVPSSTPPSGTVTNTPTSGEGFVSPTNTRSVTEPTPSSPSTLPSNFASSVKPVLMAPIYGELQNPITFIWRGSSGITHQVTLIHKDKGYKQESGWLQDFTWTFSIPAEQYGNWTWYVTNQTGATSDIGQFVFNPFPGGGSVKTPTPVPTPTPEPPPAVIPTETPIPPPTSEPENTPYPPTYP